MVKREREHAARRDSDAHLWPPVLRCTLTWHALAAPWCDSSLPCAANARRTHLTHSLSSPRCPQLWQATGRAERSAAQDSHALCPGPSAAAPPPHLHCAMAGFISRLCLLLLRYHVWPLSFVIAGMFIVGAWTEHTLEMVAWMQPTAGWGLRDVIGQHKRVGWWMAVVAGLMVPLKLWMKMAKVRASSSRSSSSSSSSSSSRAAKSNWRRSCAGCSPRCSPVFVLTFSASSPRPSLLAVLSSHPSTLVVAGAAAACSVPDDGVGGQCG